MRTRVSVVLAALAWVASTSGAALAADPPQLKEGLWSIHSRDVDMPGHKQTEFTSTLCRSHDSDRQTQQSATGIENDNGMQNCTTTQEHLQGDEYTIEARCMLRGSMVKSTSTTHFLGNATHTEAHITYSPALNGVTESTLVQDQKYLGRCPAGAKSGDLLLPNGTMQHLGRSQEPAPQHP
jgi:hypothetical protein